jgi:hypothetical protein
VKTLARRRSVKGKIPEIEADPELESRQDLTSSSVPIRVRSWNLCFTKALMFGCEGAGGTRLRAQIVGLQRRSVPNKSQSKRNGRCVERNSTLAGVRVRKLQKSSETSCKLWYWALASAGPFPFPYTADFTLVVTQGLETSTDVGSLGGRCRTPRSCFLPPSLKSARNITSSRRGDHPVLPDLGRSPGDGLS